MKQLTLALAAVAALAMASCSSDEPAAPNAGADGMTFTVKMPAQQALSRAFSDGKLATQLTWAAYEVNGSTMKYITQATSTPTWVQNTTDGTLDANISIDLAVGKSYRLIFFAKDASNTFTSLAFNTNDAKLTCNYQNITGNDESYDAFYQKLDVTVTPSYAGGDVTLYRPFAQLNVGTNDLANPFVASAYTDGVQTKVTVSKVATEFDLLNDAVLTTNELSNATFGPTTQATATDGNFPVAATPAYAWLAMDYMLVSDASDYTVTLDFYNGQNTTSLNNKVIPNVPLQRNYQTNIYGSLLSSTTNFTVKIQPAFVNSADPDAYPDFLVGPAHNIAQLNAWLAAGKKVVRLASSPTEQAVINMPASGDATVILENFSSNHGFVVNGNGTVELSNVTIKPTTTNEPGILINNTVTLLANGGTVTGGPGVADAVRIPNNSKVTVTGQNLTLLGSGNGGTGFHSGGSGIGYATEDEGSCGEIVITNMTNLVAQGNSGHAFGLGGSSCPKITIDNSTITKVVGGIPQQFFVNDLKYGSNEPEGGAGIGAEVVNITNSTIKEAIGGSKSAAIGNRYWRSTNVTITGSTIEKAIGGNASAGIGSGRYSYGTPAPVFHTTVTITDSKVYAEGGEYGAGIGSGYNTKTDGVTPDCECIINISGTSDITAKGGKYSPGIGTGYHGPWLSGSIASSVTVKATSGEKYYKKGYTEAQNIGYGILDPAREGAMTISNWQHPTFTVNGQAIPVPTVAQN